ncbi:hypothetical protein [Vagococcus xieshaowenii]|uniref:hypothetical protein n=1 Tax=Vagococcus xieshaowenii TaxID=2562451 RepID=UPI0014326FAE|nr:hypothetical protein [Vagococcus xieshaowenii]
MKLEVIEKIKKIVSDFDSSGKKGIVMNAGFTHDGWFIALTLKKLGITVINKNDYFEL